jgi:hypothetical protein
MLVEGALGEAKRHIRQGRGIGDRAHELRSPGLTCSAAVSDFQALEIGIRAQRLIGAEPVEKSQIKPWTNHMRAQSLLDLSRHQRSCPAIDNLVHEVD